MYIECMHAELGYLHGHSICLKFISFITVCSESWYYLGKLRKSPGQASACICHWYLGAHTLPPRTCFYVFPRKTFGCSQLLVETNHRQKHEHVKFPREPYQFILGTLAHRWFWESSESLHHLLKISLLHFDRCTFYGCTCMLFVQAHT